MEHLREGMVVRVSKNLDETHYRHTATPEMHALRGKNIKISRIRVNGSVSAGPFNSNGILKGKCWNWDPIDLLPADDNPDGITFSPKKSKVETFDPHQLVID